jgi:hypothetical protein
LNIEKRELEAIPISGRIRKSGSKSVEDDGKGEFSKHSCET